jgi:aryl-alcohol dehydrogenase-like predicted oxidoreductase
MTWRPTAGLVQAIGVSVYTPEALAALLDEGAEVDLVQLPFNVFDRRFAPMLRRLKAAGVEVHARSAFLQGLFFLDPERLPPFFAPVRERLVTLRALAARHELPLAALPLGFALAQPDIDTVVVGVDGLANLRENLALAARLPDLRPLLSHIEELEVRDEDILLPYRWKNS